MLLFFRRKNTLYDIDDAEYLNFPPSTINYFMKNCEACSVGSKALKKYAEKFNSNVFLLTSPIIAHNKIKKERNKTLTIGWIGFYNTDEKDTDEYAHKKSIYKLFLPALLDIEFKIKLVIIGITSKRDKKEINDYFSRNKNISIEIPENINWQDELSIYDRIKEFDIGISPLLDTERNRAKSAFKLKQYFSCGVPALGSSVGENSAFLENGVNGYLCETPDDYKKTISKLKFMSEADFNQFSSNALKSVVDFKMKTYCCSFLRFYENSVIIEEVYKDEPEAIEEIV